MRASELRHAVTTELLRRGHDTRGLIVLYLPRPEGEPPIVDSPDCPSRVICALDLPEDDPVRRRWDQAVRELEASLRKP